MSDDLIYLDTSIIVTPFLKNREPAVLERCEALLERAGHEPLPSSRVGSLGTKRPGPGDVPRDASTANAHTPSARRC